jgi:hypothetical protein
VSAYASLNRSSSGRNRKTNINVKRRLKNSVHFWEKFGTSDFILDIIYEGYKIPLLHEPKLVNIYALD